VTTNPHSSTFDPPEEVEDHFPEMSIEECLAAVHDDHISYTDERSKGESEAAERMYKSLRYKLSGYSK
jgi:hypothetical protein